VKADFPLSRESTESPDPAAFGDVSTIRFAKLIGVRLAAILTPPSERIFGSKFDRVRSSSEIVSAYWAAANDRDWDAFKRLLADDVVYEGPQTRERVRGASNYVRFNVEGFPGEWHLRVVRVVGEGLHVVSWIDFTNSDGTTQPGLCFFELNNAGKVTRITDFWPDPYDLPAQRAHLVERY
jgi:hypothetical protein